MQPGLRPTVLAREMGMSPRDGKCLSCHDIVIKTRVDLTPTFSALSNPICRYTLPPPPDPLKRALYLVHITVVPSLAGKASCSGTSGVQFRSGNEQVKNSAVTCFPGFEGFSHPVFPQSCCPFPLAARSL